MNRKSMYTLVAIVIIAIAAALIFMSIYGSGSGQYLVQYINKPVPQSLVSVLNVSSAVSNKVGLGVVTPLSSSYSGIKKITAAPLTSNGKPEVLYIGAEYCPYCAITRWSMIIALSRFGTFSNLHYMISNTSDPEAPGTPTFTFYGSSYTSNYIDFVPVETQNQTERALQTPSAQQGYIFSKFNPGGGIPFIDFGNQSLQLGALADPFTIQKYNWTQIASQLPVTNSSVSLSLVGAADVETAEICAITNFTPSSVCSQPYVKQVLNS